MQVTKERVEEWLETARGDAAILRGEAPMPEGVSRWDVEGTLRVNLSCAAENGAAGEARLIAASVPGFEL